MNAKSSFHRRAALALAMLVIFCCVIATPVFADDLNITGGVPAVACGNPSVSSGSLSFSCPPTEQVLCPIVASIPTQATSRCPNRRV